MVTVCCLVLNSWADTRKEMTPVSFAGALKKLADMW